MGVLFEYFTVLLQRSITIDMAREWAETEAMLYPAYGIRGGSGKIHFTGMLPMPEQELGVPLLSLPI